MTMTSTAMTTTLYLQRAEGRIAYDLRGDGPLVVCVPGMGDLRQVYRVLAPALADAGYRVATMDLRGHGDSDATFSAYDDVATGEDILALVAHLGGPAVVAGNSMGAGAAAWAAAENADAVAGIALLGPFVRDTVNPLKRFAFRAALARPWGRMVWPLAYRSLNVTRAPDLDAHIGRIAASLRRPAHWRAFSATTRTSHAPVEARLSQISCPALVVMGERDPDFSDPAAEVAFVAQRIGGGRTVMVPAAGHYPMVEQPQAVIGPVQDLLRAAFSGR